MPRELPKGDIPLLVLAALSDAPRHGYAIAREIERRTDRILSLREGALYPALRVLEQDGLIVGEWQVMPSGPARRVYALTEAGRTELARRADAWAKYTQAVEAAIGGWANGTKNAPETA
jgi:PadR family transcriptional regulator, regulatory protein PadR